MWSDVIRGSGESDEDGKAACQFIVTKYLSSLARLGWPQRFDQVNL